MQQAKSSTDANSRVTVLFVLLLLSIVLVVVMTVLFYRRRVKMEENKFIIENAHLVGEPIRGTMEEVGFVDEADLEDVLL
jgi:hypothetical protein